MNPAFGLHQLPDPELKRLLRALHRGVLPSPITRSALIEKAFGHIEAHLDAIIGRDVASAKAVVVAVMAARGADRGQTVQLSYSGVVTAGTRSRDLVEQVRELLASTKQSAQLYGLRVADDRGLLSTVGSLVAGRGVRARLVFDGAGLSDPLAEVRAFVQARVRSEQPIELYVARVNLRARLAIVDDTRVLLTSGDLSGSEADGAIDVGALFDDAAYVRAWEGEWTRLVASGSCVSVPLA